MLAGQEECLEFDPALFTAFVEKVVVSGTKKDVRLRRSEERRVGKEFPRGREHLLHDGAVH